MIQKGRAEVNITLPRILRQYKQLPQFEMGTIIGMMESERSARLVARQLDCSDCVPTASSATLQLQVAPSLGAPVSSRTIRRCLAEEPLGSWCPLRVLPLTPTH
ncbi:transposable element Tcb2 transposase [Trichonephila clavipes]|nr:transposable element Tcb2 transposase [Trichonephila clavipes]